VPGIDTRTRFQGVFKRHQEGCIAETDRSKCNCKGKYWGSAWDREKGRTRKTERLSSARAAREARRELQKKVERGELSSGPGLALRELRDRFLADVEEGVALNKRGKGKLSIERVGERIRDRWLALGMEPIGFQHCRHTAATWLDHAGVTPKVASQIMGHRTPEFQPGAARITLQRYTHVLPGELERAREELDKFLIERSTSAKKEVPGCNG
jgi:integrase